MTDFIDTSVPTINNLRDSLNFLSSQTSAGPSARVGGGSFPARGVYMGVLEYSNMRIS